MTIKELKEIAPLADVYELKPDVKYIAFVSDRSTRESMQTLSAQLNGATIFVVQDASEVPKMFELEDA